MTRKGRATQGRDAEASVSVREAGRRLSVQPYQVRNMMAAGDLATVPHYVGGRRVLQVSLASVEAKVRELNAERALLGAAPAA